MTILQLISSEGFYGAESMLLALARSLADLGCRAIAGVFRDPRCSGRELEIRAAQLGLQVALVPCAGRWDWSAVRRIRSLVEDHAVDVLHTHGYKADLYGYAAAWPRRVALVATCHNWAGRAPAMRLYAAIDRLALRRFGRVATPSAAVARVLGRRNMPAEILKTIPNGIAMEPFRRAEPSLRAAFAPGGQRLVGMVGRLVPEKGGATLLAAARTVLAQEPDVRFVFVGDGPERAAWESLAAAMGIASQVLFAGSRNDMPAVYASLDVLALPSFREAMPMCLLEALAAARPVVASRVGAVPDVVIPGVTGLLVDPGDAPALSAALLRLLRDPARAAALGSQGRARVARYFASASVAASYLNLYREALRDRSLAGLRPVCQRSRP